MIDRATVDRIYAAANIVDVIGEYVTLRRKGVNYQACCPFHNEKTPSFVVSPTKGVFKCFGCGKSGNAVTFVMEHESISYPEALKVVAKKYGIEVEETKLTEEEERRNDNRESMFALNSWTADYFSKYLSRNDEGVAVGLSYFRQKRGFTDEIISRFGLGFCPSKGDRFSSDAMAAGYKREFLLSTGLSLERESDGSLYDRFRDRVMFPVHNISGRIVAFGGRTLRTDKSVAKYQNSPESEIYSKKRELYGLYFAKKAIQREDCAIMVEGYTDVISMHQSGVENVVASSGTSLTVEQIRLLSRFTHNITIIYDGDSAGVKASLRGIDLVLTEGMNVRIVLLPEQDDPDSFARAHTAEQVQEYVRRNEVDFITFKARLLLDEAGDDPIRKAAVISDIVASITHIGDSIQRSVYIKECAKMFEVDERTLLEEVARKRVVMSDGAQGGEFVRREQLRQSAEQAAADFDLDYTRGGDVGCATVELERELIKYLLKAGHKSFEFKDGKEIIELNVAEVILTNLEIQGLKFSNPTYQTILQLYKAQYEQLGEGVEVPMHLFVNHSDSEVCNQTVDILTAEDNYVPSQIWKKKDVHVESEDEMLSIGVPKLVMLYKSDAIKRLIEVQRNKLSQEDISEEEMLDAMNIITNLNREKVSIAHRLKRSIL